MPQAQPTLNSIAKEHLLHGIITKMDDNEGFIKEFNELLFIEDCITTIANIYAPGNSNREEPLLKLTTERLKMLLKRQDSPLSTILSSENHFEEVIQLIYNKDAKEKLLDELRTIKSTATTNVIAFYEGRDSISGIRNKITEKLNEKANSDNTLKTHLKIYKPLLEQNETTQTPTGKSLSEIITQLLKEELSDRFLHNGQHSITKAKETAQRGRITSHLIKTVTKVDTVKTAQQLAEQAVNTSVFPSNLLKGEIQNVQTKIDGMVDLITLLSPPISPSDDDLSAALDRNNKNRMFWIKKLLLLDSMSIEVTVSADDAQIYQHCSLLHSQLLNLIADKDNENISNLNQLTKIIIQCKDIVQKFDPKEEPTIESQLHEIQATLDTVETMQEDYLTIKEELIKEYQKSNQDTQCLAFEQELNKRQALWLSEKIGNFLCKKGNGNTEDKKNLIELLESMLNNDSRSPLFDIINPKKQRNLVIALFIFTVVSTNTNTIFSVAIALSHAGLTTELITSSLAHLGFSVVLTGLAMYALYRLMLAPAAKVSNTSHGLFSWNNKKKNSAKKAKQPNDETHIAIEIIQSGQ